MLNGFEAALAQRRQAQRELERQDRRQAQRDMAAAHAEGLHDELPREGCPECPRRHGARAR